MARPLQVFEVPGGCRLEETGSPWRLGGRVEVPFVLWRRLRAAIEAHVPEASSYMQAWSVEDAEDDRVDIDRTSLSMLIDRFREIEAMPPGLLALPALDPDAPSPDFEPEEYQRILGDVTDVLTVSLEACQSFSAWLE